MIHLFHCFVAITVKQRNNATSNLWAYTSSKKRDSHKHMDFRCHERCGNSGTIFLKTGPREGIDTERKPDGSRLGEY